MRERIEVSSEWLPTERVKLLTLIKEDIALLNQLKQRDDLFDVKLLALAFKRSQQDLEQLIYVVTKMPAYLLENNRGKLAAYIKE